MQNPPPGQPGSGIPPRAPQSGSGLEPNIAAALSYIWIVGVIFYLLEKENRFIRFHAMQSILFGIANSVLMMVLVVVAMILTFISIGTSAAVGGAVGSLMGLLVWVIWMLFWLIAMALFVGLIFAAVKAYQGQMFKLPIIGNMAEKIVNK